MLPKAHLTSHSWMSGSVWLSGLWRSFLHSSSVYSCHLFLIPSASVRSIPFLSFIVSIFAWNAPLLDLVHLNRSLVFPILLFSSNSLHWSLRKTFLSLSLLFFGTLHSKLWCFGSLHIYLSAHLCVSIHSSIHLFTYLSLHLPIYLCVPIFICLILPIYLSRYPSIHVSVFLSTYLFLSAFLHWFQLMF